MYSLFLKKSFRGLVNSDAADTEAVRAVVVVLGVDRTTRIEVQVTLVYPIGSNRPEVAVGSHIVDAGRSTVTVATQALSNLFLFFATEYDQYHKKCKNSFKFLP